MTADLRDRCAELAALLPQAGDLLAEPDTDGTTGRTQPDSRPPWNQQAADAAMDAHAGLRDLEAVMHYAVTGQARRERGGSDANTLRAIAAIEALGDVTGGARAAEAARIIGRWANAILQLPGVDEVERSQQVAAPCPYCGFAMLRVFPRSGRVACLRIGACQDGDGNHPTGRMELSRLDGSPCVTWADGLVT